MPDTPPGTAVGAELQEALDAAVMLTSFTTDPRAGSGSLATRPRRPTSPSGRATLRSRRPDRPARSAFPSPRPTPAGRRPSTTGRSSRASPPDDRHAPAPRPRGPAPNRDSLEARLPANDASR